MARIRRSASSKAVRPAASVSSKRRAWRRSRDEIVWRLFFTRWCTSRMVASLVKRSRSLRRRSVTSRSRIAAPVTSPLEMRGMQRIINMTSGSLSTSSIAGSLFAKASSTAEVSSPRAAKLEPTIAEVIDARCKAFTAFGDAKVMRSRESMTSTPSPTRGASSTAASSSTKGNSPSATMTDNLSKSSR